MEIDPDNQKTLPDFLITQRELGIAIVDILKLIKRGNKLFYKKDGREIEVRRIYNRCIVDELERKTDQAAFRFSRRARCGMGGPSQLVLPHQQIFNSLPQAPLGAEDVVSRSTSGLPGRSRKLPAEAAVFVRRRGH